MYQYINEHVGQLVGGLNPNANDPYLAIRDMVADPNVNLADNQGFQTMFSSHYKLHGAGLGAEYLQEYYRHFEAVRQGADAGLPSIEQVIEHLYQFPANNAGWHRLEFSFSTKLLHTLDPNRPIFDSRVGRFYFMPASLGRNHAAAVQGAVARYDFLVAEYARVLAQNLLGHAIAEFRQHLPEDAAEAYTDVKIIDYLICAFVSYAEHQGILAGNIAYN